MEQQQEPAVRPPYKREILETKLINLVAGGIERTSWDTCRHVGSYLGLLMFAALIRRRAVATANIRLAFPELSEAAARQIARRSAQNFGMTFCEFMRLRVATPEEIRAYVSIQNLENVQEGLSHGNGVLLLTAHLGNWELMGARAAQEFPLTVVARPTSNTGIEERILDIRRTVGIEVISKFDTGRASLKALRQNRALGILPDQHAGPEGALLPMFGHPTRMVTAIARLAILSGAPMVPGFGVRRGPWLRDGRIVAKTAPGIYLEKPVSRDPAAREAAVIAGTRRVVSELEKIMRQYPEQWLWMHKRWRPEDALAAQAAAQAETTS
jgi:KDO2-lipid IV(A) lauroyltransferase